MTTVMKIAIFWSAFQPAGQTCIFSAAIILSKVTYFLLLSSIFKSVHDYILSELGWLNTASVSEVYNLEIETVNFIMQMIERFWQF